MSGTGLCFTGVIGVGSLFPTEHACVGGRDVGGATSTVTLGPPPGIVTGDVMVACYGGGSYSGGGSWTVTPASGWTLVHSADLDGAGYVNLYSKIADAADEAGTASYSWSITRSSSLTGLTVIHTGWPRRFGTIVTGGASDTSGAPSITTPGGYWQFAFIYERSADGGSQPSPNPVVSSPATAWCEQTSGTSSGHRAGNMRNYASDNESPITGAYLTGDIQFARRALLVAAVST